MFYDSAIRAIHQPEFNDEIEDNPRWQLGLFLHQQWLQDQHQSIIKELQAIQRRLYE